jgi:hypothetical protein
MEELKDNHESPRVIAYAIQLVAPMVLPGKKVGSTLTSAIGVDNDESAGAWMASCGCDTSKVMCWWALYEDI